MARKDKSRNLWKPPAAKGKYEMTQEFKPGMNFKAEQIHGTAQGCGDENCRICRPLDPRAKGDYRQGGSDERGSNRSDFEKLYEMAKRYGISPFAPFDDTRNYLSAPSPKPTHPPTYTAARKAVEAYLLTSAHTTRWSDVIGNDEAKTALISAIETPTKHAELFAHYGKAHSRGVLLFGPPGCGKTMLAKAVVGEMSRLHGTKAELLLINGPEIQSSYVGQTESCIREIFTFAREYFAFHKHPLVIFIDEADSILPDRTTRSASHEISNVSTFLAEMDGLKAAGAFVMLATNRPEAIDPALLRDGRCDRRIEIKRPTLEAAEEMLLRALEPAPRADDLYDLLNAVLPRMKSTTPLRSGVAVSGAKIKRWSLVFTDLLNAAMVGGLVERAKELAMNRDIAAGTRTGISAQDMSLALDALIVDLTTTVSEDTIRATLDRFPTEDLVDSMIDKLSQSFQLHSEPKGTMQ